MLVNIDEAFDLLRMLGVTTEDGSSQGGAQKGDAKALQSTSAASGLPIFDAMSISSFCRRSCSAISFSAFPAICTRWVGLDAPRGHWCAPGPAVEPHADVSTKVVYSNDV